MKHQDKDFKAELITLNEAYNGCLKLAGKIKKSDYKIDAVVGIARGGLPPARFICDFLNIETLFVVQVKHYVGGAEEQKKTSVLNKNIGDLSGKNILLVDDVNDSGKTLKAAHELLQDAKNVKIAVIHEKDTTEHRADFVGERVSDWRWIIYQWAAAEDVLRFLKEGSMLDANPTDAREFLEKNYELQIESTLMESLLELKDSYY